MVAVGRGIREIVSLVAYCQLDWPAALAEDAPDIVSAGNVCLEIEVLAVNGPAKSEHRACIVESVNVQRTISRAGWAGDRVAGQFRSWSRKQLARAGNREFLELLDSYFLPSGPESFEAL